MTVLTTNQAFIHLSVFELTPYPSLLDSWDPSAPLHLFTSYVSPHLSIHHSSTYLWPNTQFHQLHAALTATHPPFRSIICFFFTTLMHATFIPSPVSTSHLNQTALTENPLFPATLVFQDSFSLQRAKLRNFSDFFLSNVCFSAVVVVILEGLCKG